MPPFSAAYKRYALVAITALYGVSLLDGAIVGLLLQSIKQDLQLSDTQLGFLTGLSFSLFYATLGVPLARWTDRGNRVTITSLVMGIGAVAAVALSFVTSYAQLLLVRIFSAVSDAGCRPATYSLLGDYFPEQAERTRAMYAWFLASQLAALVAWTSAGWLNEHYGWRSAFLLAGLVALPLAILGKLTLLEPRRVVVSSAPTSIPPLSAVFGLLWRQRSCRYLTFAIVMLFMVGQGAFVWNATFMIRTYGIGTAELGKWLGVIAGLGGVVALLLGRYVVERWFAENAGAQLRLTAASLVVGAPVYLGFLLAPTKETALVAFTLLTVIIGGFAVSPYVMLQRLVPDEMRATVLMVVMLLANLIGAGVGPLIVGGMSDFLTPMLGADGLRYAMMLGALEWLFASYCFFKVAGAVDRDLITAQHQAVSST